jgi:hypothetical protein
MNTSLVSYYGIKSAQFQCEMLGEKGVPVPALERQYDSERDPTTYLLKH